MKKRASAKGKSTLELDQRKHLHRFVDRLCDGPPGHDPDAWVRTVLSDIGNIFRMASSAIDYECGRVCDGVDRASGIFQASSPFARWEGADICVDAPTAKRWTDSGHAKRSIAPPPEVIRKILIAILEPISRASYHPWLFVLVDALDALAFGEQRTILKPAAEGLHSIGRGRDAWMLRLHAVAWMEFQIASELLSKPAAERAAAAAFGRDVRSVRGWRQLANDKLGSVRVDAEVDYARACGRDYRLIRNRVESGVRDPGMARRIAHYVDVFGNDDLKRSGQAFRNLPRKKSRS
ncbi:MAG TPA: hypothetical protein VHC71_01345 [Hyphomicrobium sp.]|nr:hypothetical protein [Hyphomicrobium sp.]